MVDSLLHKSRACHCVHKEVQFLYQATKACRYRLVSRYNNRLLACLCLLAVSRHAGTQDQGNQEFPILSYPRAPSMRSAAGSSSVAKPSRSALLGPAPRAVSMCPQRPGMLARNPPDHAPNSWLRPNLSRVLLAHEPRGRLFGQAAVVQPQTLHVAVGSDPLRLRGAFHLLYLHFKEARSPNQRGKPGASAVRTAPGLPCGRY